MHKLRALPGEPLDGIRELDDLVAVGSTNPAIHETQDGRLDGPVGLPAGVIEVVGVQDANDVVEFVRPPRAVMVPCQVLWLLQYRDIRLVLGNPLHRNSRSCFGWKISQKNTIWAIFHYLIIICSSFPSWDVHNLPRRRIRRTQTE
jgi:hypothetical protein